MAATEGQAPGALTLRCVWLELRAGGEGQGQRVGTWPRPLPSPAVACAESQGSGLCVCPTSVWARSTDPQSIPRWDPRVTAGLSFCATARLSLNCPPKWGFPLLFKPLPGRRVSRLPPCSGLSGSDVVNLRPPQFPIPQHLLWARCRARLGGGGETHVDERLSCSES